MSFGIFLECVPQWTLQMRFGTISYVWLLLLSNCFQISCKYIMHDFWSIALGLATTDVSYKFKIKRVVQIGSDRLCRTTGEETPTCMPVYGHTKHLGTSQRQILRWSAMDRTCNVSIQYKVAEISVEWHWRESYGRNPDFCFLFQIRTTLCTNLHLPSRVTDTIVDRFYDRLACETVRVF
jgi:hypothetical protein